MAVVQTRNDDTPWTLDEGADSNFEILNSANETRIYTRYLASVNGKVFANYSGSSWFVTTKGLLSVADDLEAARAD